MKLAAAGIAFVLGSVLLGLAPHQPAKEPAPKNPFAGLYPLPNCPVSGSPLTKSSVVKQIDGREVRFASEADAATFESNKSEWFAKIDQAIAADQGPSYPANACLISGDPLGGHDGESPADVVINNRLVKVCCKGCIGDAKKDGAELVARLDAMSIAAQTDRYPLKKCPISGEELGSMGAPIEGVIGGRVVKLCCKGCLKKAKAEPATLVATIDAAWKDAGGYPSPASPSGK